MASVVDADVAALEDTVLNGAAMPAEREQQAQLLAAATIRRQANQHQCHEESTSAPCGHPDHRRDRFYAAAMLEMLGIPRDLPLPTAEDRIAYLRQEVPAKNPGPQRRWGYSDVSGKGNFK